MNKEVILLQPEDLMGINVIFKHVYEASQEDIAKAAQAKLMKVLKEPCKHGMKIRTVDMAYGCQASVVYNRLVDCPECMAEIDKILS